ncbi:Helix-turn-helix domain-containing protein [Hymenobacter gelipurpurascens]|uniref:Helix-turn-helix domain-containing protein n=1 Tax=Hymenobacter gelipurpurascens TaxID=89968 RepID=A0A212T8R2_9BACT|nr:helix-turn-helix domain-containing protein [Hymenobacter gelipurpurascens]SNC62409.1 Helix-turn-helix domain-containing protein [Hymenobacter gelipurpurascens]
MDIFDINQSAIKSLMAEQFSLAAQQYYQALPKPDPQFTCEEVADILGLEVSTVRGYLRLPSYHQRNLPVVQCTESSRGYRIRLSAVQAWQERNSLTLDQDKAQLPEQLLRISHRRTGRRLKAAS